MAVLKTHVALNVADIEKSVAFYRAMFGVAPMKHKADYAKFDIANPPLNLMLNLASNAQSGDALSHLGMQVETTFDVQKAITRFVEAGLATFTESDTDCCYALQDKVWVTDPDGNSWEVFTVKLADTAPELQLTDLNEPNTASTVAKKPCCA